MRAVPCLALVLVALAATPAAAQEPAPTPTPAPTVVPTPAPTPPPEPRIAPGVVSGGVDLSNLTISEAEAALTAALAKKVRKPTAVRVANRRFQIGPRKVKLEFDANRTARRAYHAGRRNPPAAGKQLVVPPAIDFHRKPIRRFVAKVARKVHVAPRDATVRITLTRIYKRPGANGRRLPDKKVNRQLDKMWADPLRPRTLRIGRKWVKPDVRSRELRRRYPAIITIDQSSFTLRLFRKLRFARSYGVAVGQPAYPTPNGLFSIQSKQVNPTWTAPNSPWAGEMAGQSVSGGDPNNPLKARWMGVNGAVGIHGTGQEYSIGTRASHGCIRMRVADVIDLYDRVHVGAPVLIAP